VGDLHHIACSNTAVPAPWSESAAYCGAPLSSVAYLYPWMALADPPILLGARPCADCMDLCRLAAGLRLLGGEAA
jgi:hypothetical protein